MMVSSLDVTVCILICFSFFFFKQKTAYEMRISDWSSDVCSSDLDFHMINGEVLRNTLPQSCPQLGFERAFSYKTSLSQLCNVDKIGRASCRERVCQYV